MIFDKLNSAKMDQNKKLFPQRLWELVHDEKYDFCLRWSPDGQRIYLNRNEFEVNYLRTPNNQFLTKKAISFVRQMNMYGFRKVDDCYYENDNFKRNCHNLLKNMIRRHSNKPNSNHHGTTGHNNSASSTQSRSCSSNDGHTTNNRHSSTDRQMFNNNNTNNNYSTSNCGNSGSNNNSGNTNNLFSNNSASNINVSDGNSNNFAVNQVQEHPIAPIQTLLGQFTGMDTTGLCNPTASLRHRSSPYGSSGTSSPLSNIEFSTALANANASGLPASSLNSTLYRRLAELNFNPSSNLFRGQATERQLHQQQHSHYGQHPLVVQSTNSESAIDQILNVSSRLPRQQTPLDIQQQRSQRQQQIDIMNSTISQQQALAAHQAVLQQSLVGSLLQLRQPSPLASLEQSFLSTLRRQSASLMLNHIPFSSNLDTPTNETATNLFQPSNVPPNDASEPLELVVDSSRSSSTSDRQNSSGKSQSDHTYDRNYNSMYNLAPQSLVSIPSCWSLPGRRRDEDFTIDDEDDYYNIDQDDESFIRNSTNDTSS